MAYTHVNLKKKGCVGQTVTPENINNNKNLKIRRLSPHYPF